MSSQPKVSVIIPVMNDAEDLARTLDALAAQEYPRDLLEVIVVDNGSEDGSPEIARRYEGVLVLEEREHPGSPYSARNRGIEASSGEIIALVDSTCVPEHDWAKEAVKALEDSGSDLVGGDVLFWYPRGGCAAEVVDSITNVRVERSIRERNVAPTANLIVRRDAFERIGLFQEGVRSGEDVGWTGRATAAGLTLSFAPKAVVRKRARSLGDLTRKAWRVSRGSARLRAESSARRSLPLSRFLELVIPRDTKMVFSEIRAGREKGEFGRSSLPAAYCVLLWLTLVRAFGVVYHTLAQRLHA